MFRNHEIKYIKRKKTANFLQVSSREFIVNSGFLPSRMKRKEDPADEEVITLRNRAWKSAENVSTYLCEPKRMDAPDIGKSAFWTYWEDDISRL